MMTKKPKHILPKEAVMLKMKKLKSGSHSLYLDFYRDGKRRQEYLQMYLIPGRDKLSRQQNAVTLAAAHAIKVRRTIAMVCGMAGITKPAAQEDMTLARWLDIYKERQHSHGKKNGRMIEAVGHICRRFRGGQVRMGDIDRNYCREYIDFLLSGYRTGAGSRLAANTAHNYYRTLNTVLNAAVREEIITANPFARLSAAEKIRKPESRREYLSIEEVRRLIATPAPRKAVKQAFIFACLCGLRISDVLRLKWNNIVNRGAGKYIETVIKKTQTPLYIPLSEAAKSWLPPAGEAKEQVFVLPTPQRINQLLKTWATAAGIAKNISFHTARHTFATMMLTLGADLYTTSKLLGHTDVRMTQSYAKIVNEKKIKAVNLANSVFLQNNT